MSWWSCKVPKHLVTLSNKREHEAFKETKQWIRVEGIALTIQATDS